MKGLSEVGSRGVRIKTRNDKRTLEKSGIVIDVEKEVVELSLEEFNFRATKKVKVKEKEKSKGKGKQVMIQNVIDVDNDDSLTDTNKVKLGGNYKGKDLIYLSDDDGSDEEKGLSCMTAGRTGTGNQSKLNNLSQKSSYSYKDGYNYFYKDDDFEHLPQDWSGMNDLSYLQTQFEASNIPTGIEASRPWLLEPGLRNGQTVNFSSPSNFDFSTAQPILGSGFNQMTHSHENRSVEAKLSTAGFSYSNVSQCVSLNHESLPEKNHAPSSSVAAASTELSGGTKIPAANNVHEDAIKRIKQFENFAIVGDFSDHHFANNLVSTQPQKAWAKKIQDEWKILQSSLPETIFVRACESKMSLLRVAIIGPQGTPYHDGLFFFDVMFPSTYPQAPPQVYYHSGGLRLNPNLYVCGKVCLSLLGTWPGQSAAENWNPGKSTMLQVLVSIQALILNAKPYFNEPGYAGSEGSCNGEKASQMYNEDTLIKSLKTMLYSLRRPPKHFEGLVSDHFITRSRDILLACNAYMDGAQVGAVSIVEGKAIKDNKKKKCSPSLKDNVGVLMNTLIDEFAKLGVKNCEEFRTPESDSKIEESKGISSGDFQFLTNLKSVIQKKSKAKSKKGSANKLAPTPPSVSAAYPFPPPSVAWNPSTAAWIAPSAFHSSSAAMPSLPHPVMPPNVLQKMSDA